MPVVTVSIGDCKDMWSRTWKIDIAGKGCYVQAEMRFAFPEIVYQWDNRRVSDKRCELNSRRRQEMFEGDGLGKQRVNRRHVHCAQLILVINDD